MNPISGNSISIQPNGSHHCENIAERFQKAYEGNDENIAYELVENGWIDPKEFLHKGLKIAHLSGEKGWLNILRLLQQRGVNLNEMLEDIPGSHPLVYAAQNKHDACVRYLIDECGASWGQPLPPSHLKHCKLKIINPTLCTWTLEQRALGFPNAWECYVARNTTIGYGVLYHFLEENKLELFKKSINYLNNKDLNKLLIYSLQNGHYQKIKETRLLSKEILISSRSKSDQIPYEWAIASDLEEDALHINMITEGFSGAWVQHRLLHLRFGFKQNIKYKGENISLCGYIPKITFSAIEKSFNKMYLLGGFKGFDSSIFATHMANTKWYTSLELTTYKSSMKQHYRRGGIVVLSSAWDTHSVGVVLYKNMLFVCNKGGESGNHSGVAIYQILNTEDIKSYLKVLTKRNDKAQSFLTETLKDSSKFKHIQTLSHKQQKIGNCTWASGKLTLLAAIIACHLDKGDPLDSSVQKAKAIYEVWSKQDRIQAFKAFLNHDYIKQNTTKQLRDIGIELPSLLQNCLLKAGGKLETNEIQMLIDLIDERSKWDIELKQYFTPMHKVLFLKDFKRAEELLERGFTATLKHFYTPLHLCAYRGQVELSRKLTKYPFMNRVHDFLLPSPSLLALNQGHNELACDLIDTLEDVDKEDDQGNRLLHTAVLKEETKIVKKLLQKCSNPSMANNQNQTPLHCATSVGSFELSSMILSNREQTEFLVKHRDKKGRCPLFHALFSDNKPEERTKILRLLLDHGGDSDSSDHEKHTILELAIIMKNRSAIKLLLERGVNPIRVKVCSAFTSLMFYPEIENSDELIELMVQRGANPNLKEHRGMSPLHYAALQNNMSAVKKLIALGANINALNDLNEGPLLEAAVSGSQALIHYLLDQGADPCVVSNSQLTPLHAIVSRSDLDDVANLVHKMVQNGANKNACYDEGFTPLHIAINNMNPKGAKALIDLGCDIHALTEDNNSSLLIAANSGLPEVIEILLNHGVGPNLKDDVGITPIRLIMKHPTCETYARLIRRLMQKGADLNSTDIKGITPLIFALNCKNESGARLLIQMGCEINTISCKGFTALIFAARFASKTTIELLLEKGADPKVATKKGATPIHLIMLRTDLENMSELIQKFLDKGANIDAQTNDGDTPLVVALKDRNQNGARALIGLGCDIHKTNHKHNSPLLLAAKYRLDEIFELIVNHL